MSLIQPLLQLQEIDGRIRDLEVEIKSAPERKTKELSRLESARRSCESLKEQLKKAQAAVADAELEAASLKEKIIKLRQTQGALKTNKEFQALNLEITRAESDLETIESKQVLLMDDVNPVKTRLAMAEAGLAEEQAIVADYQREHDERYEMITEELNRAQAERSEVVKNVPAQFLNYYERLKLRRWPAVTRLNTDAGVCGGCNLVQTPATRQRVLKGKELVACESCGRILYRDTI